MRNGEWARQPACTRSVGTIMLQSDGRYFIDDQLVSLPMLKKSLKHLCIVKLLNYLTLDSLGTPLPFWYRNRQPNHFFFFFLFISYLFSLILNSSKCLHIKARLFCILPYILDLGILVMGIICLCTFNSYSIVWTTKLWCAWLYGQLLFQQELPCNAIAAEYH